MPSLLKELCDFVINFIDSESDEFQNNIRELFCKMDESYKAVNNDLKRAEKLCHECRHMLVILRLFSIEYKVAMDNLYKKTLCGFLSIYLDFKMLLYSTELDKVGYFNNLIKEIFLLLSDGEKTSIWSVVVTSHTLNNLEILKLLVGRCIKETKDCSYEHEEYIRMIWVLHVFFSLCKRSNSEEDTTKVLQAALKLKYPNGLCKWMCHHFPGFGWKGLSDSDVHESLISEKQKKSFYKQVYLSIAKDDTLKYQLEEISRSSPQEEDASSLCSESTSTKKPKPVESKESESKQRSDGEIKNSKSKKKDGKKKPTSEEKESDREDKSKSSISKAKKDLKVDSSKDKDKKSDVQASKSPKPDSSKSKPKPNTSISSFLADDEDTLDANYADQSSDDDEGKENKTNVQSDDDSLSSKKNKTAKKKGKSTIESSDAESDVQAKEKRPSRSRAAKSKKAKIVSDSETDIETQVKETKEDRVNKSVKRKSGEDPSPADTNRSYLSPEIQIDHRGDHVDSNDSDVSSLKNKSQPEKKTKKLKTGDRSTPIDKSSEASASTSTAQKNADKNVKDPYTLALEKFEEDKQIKGEPFIYLENIPVIIPKYDHDATLADILHANSQKAKQKKTTKKKNTRKR